MNKEVQYSPVNIVDELIIALAYKGATSQKLTEQAATGVSFDA